MTKRKMAGLLTAGVMAAAGLSTGVPSAQAFAGYNEIYNVSTHTCADVTGNSTTPGARIRGHQCKSSDNQLWALVHLPNGYYHVINRHSGQCFELPNTSGANGTPIEQAGCVFGYTTEEWDVRSVRHQPIYILVNHATGKCLDLNNDSAANDTPIQIWDCARVPAQVWALG